MKTHPKPRLSRAARDLLSTPSDGHAFAYHLNAKLAAALGLHASRLSDSQLDRLPEEGVILYDPDSVLDGRVDEGALAIRCLHTDTAEIHRLLGGRLSAMRVGMFDPLHEWILINAHGRRQPTAGLTWDGLGRAERITAVASLMWSLRPAGMLFERVCRLATRH